MTSEQPFGDEWDQICGGTQEEADVAYVEQRSVTKYVFTEEDVEIGARAYVRWINPPHSNRQPTETDRNRVRAILAAVAAR